MQCMKCGREIPVGQVFCDGCLKDMEKYPVKPGTAVQLPPRPKPAAVKKTYARRRPVLSLEEQVKVLKHRVWTLGTALVLALAALICIGLFSLSFVMDQQNGPLPGQNYSTTEATGAVSSSGSE